MGETASETQLNWKSQRNFTKFRSESQAAKK